MDSLLKFLDGKKTYIAAIALGIAGVLMGLGKITQEDYNHFAMVALPAALAFLRSGIGNR